MWGTPPSGLWQRCIVGYCRLIHHDSSMIHCIGWLKHQLSKACPGSWISMTKFRMENMFCSIFTGFQILIVSLGSSLCLMFQSYKPSFFGMMWLTVFQVSEFYPNKIQQIWDYVIKHNILVNFKRFTIKVYKEHFRFWSHWMRKSQATGLPVLESQALGRLVRLAPFHCAEFWLKVFCRSEKRQVWWFKNCKIMDV